MLLRDPDEILGSAMDSLNEQPLEELNMSLSYDSSVDMNTFVNPKLLESVAGMSNPYNELMLGVGNGNDMIFDFLGAGGMNF